MAPHARVRPMLALIGAGVFGVSAAQAAVYAIVRSEPDVVTVMDPAGVEPVAGSDALRQAWSVSVQKSLVSGGPQQPGYVRTLNEFDCAAHTLRWKTFTVYSRFGVPVMHKDNDDPAWNPAAPKSEAEASMWLVCDHNNRWSAVAAGSLSQVVIGLMRGWDEAAPLPPLQPVTKAPTRKAAAGKKDKAKAHR